MVSEIESAQNPASGLKVLRAMKTRSKEDAARAYRPATLTNGVTGVRETVQLFDTQAEENESLLAVDEQFEIGLDLTNAFDRFSAIEQRILFRVLVQGQSIRQATKKTTRALTVWKDWMRDVALPSLRRDLSDYANDLHDIDRPACIPSSIVPEAPAEVVNTVKCKFCPDTFTGKGEAAFRQLKGHVADAHRNEYKRAQRYAEENDHGVRRIEEEFV